MCCKGKVEPERMPPTERAAYFHGRHVHLQIVNWKLLDDDEGVQLNPENWGWKIEDSILNPVKSDKAVAPQTLLKIIWCNCKSTSKAPCSTNLCSYKKHGMNCMSSCRDYHSESCGNVQVFYCR